VRGDKDTESDPVGNLHVERVVDRAANAEGRLPDDGEVRVVLGVDGQPEGVGEQSSRPLQVPAARDVRPGDEPVAVDRFGDGSDGPAARETAHAGPRGQFAEERARRSRHLLGGGVFTEVTHTSGEDPSREVAQCHLDALVPHVDTDAIAGRCGSREQSRRSARCGLAAGDVGWYLERPFGEELRDDARNRRP
jgi:hypothetical protein